LLMGRKRPEPAFLTKCGLTHTGAMTCSVRRRRRFHPWIVSAQMLSSDHGSNCSIDGGLGSSPTIRLAPHP
jgi:hypothetical protein